MPRGYTRGFTLIELLVVIAIIAILAAILFPVFARAREKARQTSCLSNVKQLTMAMLMYTQDYDGCYPVIWDSGSGYPVGAVDGSPNMWDASALVALFTPYVKNTQLFFCPTADKNPAAHAKIGPDGKAVTNYQLNSYIVFPAYWYAMNPTKWPVGYGPISETQIEIPAQILFWEDMYEAAGTHNGGGNYGCCDGHAKWQKHGVKNGAIVAGWWW